VDKYLNGRWPGVTVATTSDGGISVRIRGTSSINGSNEPLYIVDGVPFAPNQNGALVGINPYDIASIRVLKDAADLTMYGVRGANGVVIIKTKVPKR
jgi:TonB-dependent SusC/RagA subfamily outer membrane receptor